MTMKKMISLALAVCLALALVVPVGAVEAYSDDDNVQAIMNIVDENIPDISHSPMPIMTTTLIHARELTGLNNGYPYIYEKAFYGREIASGTLYYVTNLTTTGSKKTVGVGLAQYSPSSDMFGINDTLLAKMGLKDSGYAWPKIKSNGQYGVAILNETGGVVRGTVQWSKVVN